MRAPPPSVAAREQQNHLHKILCCCLWLQAGLMEQPALRGVQGEGRCRAPWNASIFCMLDENGFEKRKRHIAKKKKKNPNPQEEGKKELKP